MSYFDILQQRNISKNTLEILEEYRKDITLSKDIPDQEFIIHKSTIHAKYLTPFTIVKNLIVSKQDEYDKMYELKRRYYGTKNQLSKNEITSLGWDLDPFKGETRPASEAKLKEIIEKDSHIRDLKKQLDLLKIDEMVLQNILDYIKFNLNKVIDKYFDVKYNY